MNLRMFGAMVLAFASGFLVNSDAAKAAFGYCPQPMAPSAFLVKPRKPFCASSRNCNEWDIQSYRREIDSYFENLKRYARQVDDYYDNSQTYIKCMADFD